MGCRQAFDFSLGSEEYQCIVFVFFCYLTGGLFVRAVHLHFSKQIKFTAPRNSSADQNSIIAISVGLSRAYERRNLQDTNSCFISITYYQDDAFTSRYIVYSTKRENFKFGFENEEKRNVEERNQWTTAAITTVESERKNRKQFYQQSNWCSSLGLAINTFWACVGGFSRCCFFRRFLCVDVISRATCLYLSLANGFGASFGWMTEKPKKTLFVSEIY